MTSAFTEDNRRFFDDLASKYDVAPWYQSVAAQITTYTQQQLDFIGISPDRHEGTQSNSKSDGVSLLDYACGTGMISRALGPYVSTIQAVDISENMVTRYRGLAANSSIASVKNATARAGNLLTKAELPVELTGPELEDFSIAAVAAALHHFEDPALAIEKLAARVKPSGILLIIDFVEEAGAHLPPNPADHTIHKHGFSMQEMKDMMEKAGLVDFGWRQMPEKVEMRMDESNPIYRTVFLARAMRRVA